VAVPADKNLMCEETENKLNARVYEQKIN
jgi:hypothetical protein